MLKELVSRNDRTAELVPVERIAERTGTFRDRARIDAVLVGCTAELGSQGWGRSRRNVRAREFIDEYARATDMGVTCPVLDEVVLVSRLHDANTAPTSGGNNQDVVAARTFPYSPSGTSEVHPRRATDWFEASGGAQTPTP